MASLAKDEERAALKAVAGLKSNADKIRALDRARYPRGKIAKLLKVRYQQVHNVLARSAKRAARAREEVAPPRQEWAQVGPDGRVVIPVAFRRALGIEGGGHVLMRLEGDGLNVVGRDTAIRRVQELVARYIPENVSLVDELIAERRAEAERESRE
jgi:bifunctional DNA-binding transcriptional regulator/antitoxin component of YhaV-PrlF toxin-antitoxin module